MVYSAGSTNDAVSTSDMSTNTISFNMIVDVFLTTIPHSLFKLEYTRPPRNSPFISDFYAIIVRSSYLRKSKSDEYLKKK